MRTDDAGDGWSLETLGSPAQVESDGEVAELVEGFNEMLTAIRERDEAIAAHVAGLEATVEQRTPELRVAKEAAVSPGRTAICRWATTGPWS